MGCTSGDVRVSDQQGKQRMVHFCTLDRGVEPLKICGTFCFRGDRVERSLPQVLPTSAHRVFPLDESRLECKND